MQLQTTSDTVFAIIGGVCGALVAVFFMSRLVAMRMKAILNKWASENEVEIVMSRVKLFSFKGPFKWWTNGRGQMVCFLRVRGRDGQERSCWIRCGTTFGGIWLSSKTEVKWEEL